MLAVATEAEAEQNDVLDNKKKKKKAGKAARTDLPDEDIDALLAELDGPKSDSAEPLQTVSGVSALLMCISLPDVELPLWAYVSHALQPASMGRIMGGA